MHGEETGDILLCLHVFPLERQVGSVYVHVRVSGDVSLLICHPATRPAISVSLADALCKLISLYTIYKYTCILCYMMHH